MGDSERSDAACQVSVIADNSTGGSANGTLKGNDILPPGPADYKAIPATQPRVLNILQGKSTATLTIPIVLDQTKEGPETIFVQVVSVSAGLVANDDVGMVTPSFRLWLSRRSRSTHHRPTRSATARTWSVCSPPPKPSTAKRSATISVRRSRSRRNC